MSTRFRHLEANSWPGLDTVEPFALQVDFSPYVWTPDVEIHLVKTRLDAGYRNVIAWDSAEERDAWYDQHSNRSFRLDSEFHVLPGQTIKLPIPFTTLNGYNQVYIEYPAMPVEYGPNRPMRFYYFISDIEYRSPSTTACVITLDEWTTHGLEVDIPYIRLERGHAPMAAVDADRYLSNPIENTDLLTTPDESYGDGGAGRITHSVDDIINAGPMWAVIAMTSDIDQSPGGFGQDGWRTPVTHSWRTQGAACYTTIAVEPADLDVFLDTIGAQAPQIMQTIEACFLIPKGLVTAARTVEYLGMSVRIIEPRQTIDSILTLSADKFDYPSEYRKIAKLYTAPYAWLEITDTSGKTQKIRIEDTTGKIQISKIASIVYPMIGIDAYVIGIGSGAGSTIEWQNFSRREFAAWGDWTATLRRFDIPTYAIVQEARQYFNFNAFWQQQQQRASIEESYRQSTTAAATQQQLTNAGLDRTAARLQQAQAEQDAALSIGLSAQAEIRAQQRQRVLGDMADDATLMGKTFEAQQEQTYLAQSQAAARTDATITRDELALGVAGAAAVVAGAGLIAGVGGAVAGGATAAEAIGGAATGGTLAAFGGAITGVVQEGLQLDAAVMSGEQEQVSLMLAATQNEELYRYTAGDYYMSKRGRLTSTQDAIYAAQDAARRASLSNQQAYQSLISAGDIATSRSAAATAKALSDDIASGSRRVNLDSIDRTARHASISAPVKIATPSGSSGDMTMPQAISVRIRTQDRGAIAAAGDQFLTHGYRLAGRQWKITTLKPMAKFSYWEGDAQIAAYDNSTTTYETIHAMFSDGVTIWEDPDDIGATSIYDNARREVA